MSATLPLAVALCVLAAALWFAARAVVQEVRAWRRAIAPQWLALPRPDRFTVHHRLHDDTVQAARLLVRVATIGQESPAPSRRAKGSPDPEAVAAKRAAEDSVARMGLQIKALYDEAGQSVPLERCLEEAQAMLNGVDPWA